MASQGAVSGVASPDTVIPGEEEYYRTGVIPSSIATPPGAPATEPETVASVEPISAEVAEPVATPTEETPPTTDWRAILDKVDPKELRSHPRFAGMLGGEAERLANVKASAMAQEAAARAADAERRRLRDDDPQRFAALDAQREAEAAQRAAIVAEFDAPLTTLYAELPDEAQRTLSGKRYGGSAAESRQAYLRDVIQGHVDAAKIVIRAEERAKLEKELRPAIEKQILAKVNGGRPAPDVTGSQGAPRARLTLKELEGMSLDEYKSRAKEIDAFVMGMTAG